MYDLKDSLVEFGLFVLFGLTVACAHIFNLEQRKKIRQIEYRIEYYQEKADMYDEMAKEAERVTDSIKSKLLETDSTGLLKLYIESLQDNDSDELPSMIDESSDPPPSYGGDGEDREGMLPVLH